MMVFHGNRLTVVLGLQYGPYGGEGGDIIGNVHRAAFYSVIFETRKDEGNGVQ